MTDRVVAAARVSKTVLRWGVVVVTLLIFARLVAGADMYPSQHFHGTVTLTTEAGRACVAKGFIEDDGPPSASYENSFRFVILDGTKCDDVTAVAWSYRYVRVTATQRGHVTLDVGRSKSGGSGLLYLELDPESSADRDAIREARNSRGPGCQLGSEEILQRARVYRRAEDNAIVVEFWEARKSPYGARFAPEPTGRLVQGLPSFMRFYR